MKLTTFAWNVWDGRRRVEVCPFSFSFRPIRPACRPLTVTPTDTRTNQHAPYVGPRQVADENARHKIPFIARILRLFVRRPPSCSSCDSYIVYRLYFPGVLVGPYLEFATYSSLITGSFDVTSGGSSEPRRPIPIGRKRTAYRKMLFALGYLGIYMGLSPRISYQISVTDWFLEQSLPSRFVRSSESDHTVNPVVLRKALTFVLLHAGFLSFRSQASLSAPSITAYGS